MEVEREIGFRGKRVDNGEWVYGFYGYGLLDILADGKELHRHYIITWSPPITSPNGYFTDFEVDPATVGQFTGLRDKKRTEEYPEGQKIYEDDIIVSVYSPRDARVVEWQDGAFWVHQVLLSHNHYSTVEVIGNIHDAPELLEAAQ